MMRQPTIAEAEDQSTPNADVDYISEAIQEAISSGKLEAAARILEELRGQNEGETGYAQGDPFLARASSILLQHQIHRAGRAIAYKENPQTATGEILLLSENARRFMENDLSFHKASEHIHTTVSMNTRDMLPMTREQAEAMFRETAGEAPEETGELPVDSEDAAWIVHRHGPGDVHENRVRVPGRRQPVPEPFRQHEPGRGGRRGPLRRHTEPGRPGCQAVPLRRPQPVAGTSNPEAWDADRNPIIRHLRLWPKRRYLE